MLWARNSAIDSVRKRILQFKGSPACLRGIGEFLLKTIDLSGALVGAAAEKCSVQPSRVIRWTMLCTGSK